MRATRGFLSRLATRSKATSSSVKSGGSRGNSTCARQRRAGSGKRSSHIAPACRPDWFPNGVDSGYFSPTDEPYDLDTIAFVGRMDYYPNQECMFDFCQRTLPLLQAKRPSLVLFIVGADPSPAVRRLADLPGVTVTGSVPDVRPYLRRSALMVAPLNIARGTQNKILESMAMGVPVVTSRVAAAGVDAIDGTHFLAGSSPDDYAQAILRVMDDSGLRQRLSVAGRERMLTHHDWERSMQRLDRIVERCLSQRRSVPQSERLAATTTIAN